jgi:hypothetical protein
MPLIVTAAVPAGLVLAPAATAQEPPDPCLLTFEAAEATITGTQRPDRRYRGP